MIRREIVALVTMLAAAPAPAYQVTGPVVELSDSKVVVKKGKSNLEIARDAATRVSGDIQPGARVTVDYRMTATSIEPKVKGKAKPRSKDN